MGTPRLTPYPFKGFLYEIFSNFGRKIGDVWRGWDFFYGWFGDHHLGHFKIPIYLGAYLG